ncbi:MAG TPA: hypothetical protein VGN37_25380 [Actinocatenispora sp.]
MSASRPKPATAVPVLLLVAAALGLVHLLLAALVWTHAADGFDRLAALPAQLRAQVHTGAARTAVTVAAAYPAVLGVALLALVPLAVLLWRRRIPAPVTVIAAGVLAAGQVLAIAVAVGVRQVVASATDRLSGCGSWPVCSPRSATVSRLGDDVRADLLPDWYLPVSVGLAVAVLALLVVGVVLLLRTGVVRPGRSAGPGARALDATGHATAG